MTPGDAPDELVVPVGCNGPPDSGNGGWVCGAVASRLGVAAEVTLHAPPPLGRPLSVGPGEADSHLVVRDGATTVASARPRVGDLEPTPSVPPAAAAAAEARYPGFTEHAFPTCLTCGPERSAEDGLRIFAGPVEGRPGLVATTWTPAPWTAAAPDADGTVDERFVWAALDCPSGWAHLGDGSVVVLGRMAAELRAPVRVGTRYVVVGQSTGADGRKRFSGSTLFDEAGTAVAVARATWIAVPPPAPPAG